MEDFDVNKQSTTVFSRKIREVWSKIAPFYLILDLANIVHHENKIVFGASKKE